MPGSRQRGRVREAGDNSRGTSLERPDREQVEYGLAIRLCGTKFPLSYPGASVPAVLAEGDVGAERLHRCSRSGL